MYLFVALKQIFINTPVMSTYTTIVKMLYPNSYFTLEVTEKPSFALIDWGNVDIICNYSAGDQILLIQFTHNYVVNQNKWRR